MKRIRVLLSTPSRMLHEMLSEVIQVQPDMELVSDADGTAGLRGAVARTHPDILVVIPEHKIDRGSFEDLLFAAPRLRVLAVSDNGRTGLLYRLRPSRARLGEMSPAALLDAIRATVPPEPAQRT